MCFSHNWDAVVLLVVCSFLPQRVHHNTSPHCFQVLKLLIMAWDRRLIFTIGTSSTTGESDTVVWNEIHHKTEFGSNLTGHGYPDPNYLDNVLTELSAQGVGEDNLKDWCPVELVQWNTTHHALPWEQGHCMTGQNAANNSLLPTNTNTLQRWWHKSDRSKINDVVMINILVLHKLKSPLCCIHHLSILSSCQMFLWVEDCKDKEKYLSQCW